MYPRICVLLSTYNGKKYLDEQLESILKQQNVDVDVLVRDDGSVDGTQQILRKWEKTGKVSWYQGENCGPAHSFMDLIMQVDGQYDYYAFADQDDKWKPEKLEKAVIKLKDNQKESLYHSKTTLVNCKLEEIQSPFKEPYEINSFGASLVTTTAVGCTMVWNRKLMDKLKLHYPNYLIMHDSWIYVVCRAFDGAIVYDKESYILYRQHENNVIGSVKKQQYSGWRLLKYRISKFFYTGYSNSLVAKELVAGYQDLLPAENYSLAKTLANAKCRIVDRIKVLLSRKIRTGHFVFDCQFCWKIIIGKI